MSARSNGVTPTARHVRKLDAARRELARTAAQAGETAVAAGTVISHRLALQALGDTSEVGRMGSEKVAAFSAAGTAVLGEWQAMNWEIGRLALAELQAAVGVAFSFGMGLTPLGMVGEQQRYLSDGLSRATEHTVRMTALAAGMGGAALTPVHRTATANARRLTRRSHPAKA